MLPADYLPDYDPSVQALHQALFCALHLLANGAVVPQIVKVADKFDIRWLPAMIAAEVAQVVAELDRTLPPGLFTLIAKKGRGHTTAELENQTECLLSYLIGCLIHALSNYAEVSPAFIVFFKQHSYPFDGIGEKAMPGAIRSWLDRLFLSQRQFHPSLLISENASGDFALDVAIDCDGEAVMLKDVLTDRKMAAKQFAILKELSLLASLINGQHSIKRLSTTP